MKSTRILLLCGASLVALAGLSGCQSVGQLSQAVGGGLKSYQGVGSGLVNAVGDAHVAVGKAVVGDVPAAVAPAEPNKDKR